jgi:hypothetical protein
MGRAPSIRVSAGSWVGDYLGSILPGLPIWIKDLGGYPGAYVAGDRYGTRVGPPSWLATWLREAEAAATVHHGTWMGAPKTARVVPREVALELLDRLPAGAAGDGTLAYRGNILRGQ